MSEQIDERFKDGRLAMPNEKPWLDRLRESGRISRHTMAVFEAILKRHREYENELWDFNDDEKLEADVKNQGSFDLYFLDVIREVVKNEYFWDVHSIKLNEIKPNVFKEIGEAFLALEESTKIYRE